jgi:hypothetical protein
MSASRNQGGYRSGGRLLVAGGRYVYLASDRSELSITMLRRWFFAICYGKSPAENLKLK